MNTSEMILAVLSATLVLFINWRALATHNLPSGRLWQMAAIWVMIIVALALLLRFFTG